MQHPWTHDCLEATPRPSSHSGKRQAAPQQKTPTVHRRRSFHTAASNNESTSTIPDATKLHGGKRLVRTNSANSALSGAVVTGSDAQTDAVYTPRGRARPASASGRKTGDFLTFDATTPCNSATRTSGRRARTPPQRGQTYDISTTMKSKKRLTPAGVDPKAAATPRPVFQREETAADVPVYRPLVKRVTKIDTSYPSLAEVAKKRIPGKRMTSHPDNHILPVGSERTPMVASSVKPTGRKPTTEPAPINGNREYVAPRGLKHFEKPPGTDSATKQAGRKHTARAASVGATPGQ